MKNFQHTCAMLSVFLCGYLAHQIGYPAIFLVVAGILYILINNLMPPHVELMNKASAFVDQVAEIIEGQPNVVDIFDCAAENVSEHGFSFLIIVNEENEGLIELTGAATFSDDPKIIAEQLIKDLNEEANLN